MPPLSEQIPSIDDRRYDDIVTAVRTRIASYTPEWIPNPVWTDLNDSDPGVTMVQVFAWLTELLIYRMGKVPELNYLKFLQLLGIELRPAQPAVAEITFTVRQDPAVPETVIVPLHTQVTAAADDGGAPVVFETERALVALKARLAAVVAYDGFSYTAVTAENEAATEGFQPLGHQASDDSALLLGFDAALPARDTIDLTVWVAGGARPVQPVQCGLPERPSYGSARLAWEYYRAGSWHALDRIKDDTLAFARSGHVLLKAPPTGQMTATTVASLPGSFYWIRARVERGQYEQAPRLLAVRTNTVTALQAETSRDEVLGGSTGRPDQTFRLANRPVLHDTLHLEVDEGDGLHEWTRVDDFYGSKHDDFHYMLDRTSGEVRFGDGFNGRIPVANAANPDANIVARIYRFGGGRRGNVNARTLTTLPTGIAGIDDAEVYNLMPAHGGRDEETLRDAKQRAPRSIRSRCRAVTAEDFAHLAEQAANVKRAKALPLFHPGFPGVSVPGVVTVIVVPDSTAPAPSPSEGMLRTVCAYLDARRLLTTELYVIAPAYQLVEAQADVIVEDGTDLAAVKAKIEESLCTYFHPLRGGDDGSGWPFGGTIFYSRVYQRVFTVIGIQSIERLVIVVDGEANQECRDVPIQKAALVYSTRHAVRVRYRDEEV